MATNEQLADYVERLIEVDLPGEEIDDIISRKVSDDPRRLREIAELLLKRGEAYLAEAKRQREA